MTAGIETIPRCRVCGAARGVRVDGTVYLHNRHGVRCDGSYRPPAGYPPCGMHCARGRGFVEWPHQYDPNRPHASTLVCASPAHQAEAVLWVLSITGRLGVFRPARPLPRCG